MKHFINNKHSFYSLKLHFYKTNQNCYCLKKHKSLLLKKGNS